MNQYYLKQAESHYALAHLDGTQNEVQLAIAAALIAIAERLEALAETEWTEDKQRRLDSLVAKVID